MPLQFQPDHEAGQALYTWWTALADNKGDRAALKRCQEPLEVLFVPAYHQLHNSLRQHGQVNALRLPAVAALLAHVKHVLPDKGIAEQMAAPKQAGSDTPQVSELRFRRLLQCQTLDDLFPTLRRVVALLDGSVNLYSLADNTYWWGERVRRRWAYAYYGALR